MKRLLNGTELAGYIKERQTKEVQRLKQAMHVQPKLAIVQLKDDPVINIYVRLKKQYGRDIGVDVDVHRVKQADVKKILNMLSNDNSVNGIIVQLPIDDLGKTQATLNLVDKTKDVDALSQTTNFEPATPMAIMWLLAGYNVDLKDKQILLIGRGKLVGAPLEKQLVASGYNAKVITRESSDMSVHTKQADIIITATGSPAILYSDMIKQDAVVVDAGVASEDGKTVGDVADDVYERNDLTMTPKKGGVGPLTVCALFENVLQATRKTSE